MTSEEMKELKGLAASMGLYDDKNPCKRAVILGKAIKALEQEPCEDAIDRSKAIMIASGYCHPANVAKELAKLPSVNPQPCEDAISRQAALDCFTQTKVKNFDFILHAREEIKKLPPVNLQEPKTGHWIEHPEIETSTPEYLMFYECSECGDKQCFCKSDIHKKRFCSNCGCRMFEPQESEDKE
jgi:hypothetical protein